MYISEYKAVIYFNPLFLFSCVMHGRVPRGRWESISAGRPTLDAQRVAHQLQEWSQNEKHDSNGIRSRDFPHSLFFLFLSLSLYRPPFFFRPFFFLPLIIRIYWSFLYMKARVQTFAKCYCSGLFCYDSSFGTFSFYFYYMEYSCSIIYLCI